MIDISKLENVHLSGDRTLAACPACRSQGRDNKGEHLIIYSDGRFGCAAHQGDSEHRKKIFTLAGIVDCPKTQDRREYLLHRKRQLQEIVRAEQSRKITARLKEQRQSILARHYSSDWRADLFDETPVTPQDDGSIRHHFLSGLFQPDHILWMSKSRKDTGRPEHASYFRKCSDWLREPKLPPMLTVGTFKEGSYSRTLSNIENAPYIVIEADELIGYEPKTPEECEQNKAYCAALIRYARDGLGMTLRAVLDSGNKSLHGYFDRPSECDFEAIKRMADGLGIDRGVLENSQVMPLRMPGCPHTKSWKLAQLIYFNPISQ